MTQCPLINIDIVEIHHSNRVLRQFGMVQGIPLPINATHASLHGLSRRGKVGFDWVTKHANWIEYWRSKRPYSPTVPINWYNRITWRLISPDQYTAEIRGYQPPRTSARDVMACLFSHLKISSNRTRIDDRESMEDLITTTHRYVEEVEPIIQIPAYLVETTTPQNREAEEETTRDRRRSTARREDIRASTSRSQRRRSSTGAS
ncbi:hypothetical protein ACS0TY_013041 [Phlomoides rotata]